MCSSALERCWWLPAWISLHAARHVQRGVLGILSSRPFFSPVLSPAAQDGCFTKMENTASRSLALPSLTLPESKRGFPTHFICADEDHVDVLCFSDAESGVVACVWCLIRERIKKLFFRKVPQIIIVALVTIWFLKINVLNSHPMNIIYLIIIQ